ELSSDNFTKHRSHRSALHHLFKGLQRIFLCLPDRDKTALVTKDGSLNTRHLLQLLIAQPRPLFGQRASYLHLIFAIGRNTPQLPMTFRRHDHKKSGMVLSSEVKKVFLPGQGLVKEEIEFSTLHGRSDLIFALCDII